MVEKENIVSLSGGKDSTAMLLMMLERNIKVDEIIFCDTTVEFPDMYEHLNEVERYIGRKITRLKPKYDFEYMLSTYQGNRKHKGYGWCDFNVRWCTGYFKRDLTRKYLEKRDYILYVGIAWDERKRAKDDEKRSYPLIDWKITEEKALQYCYSKGFNWNGLYKIFKRVSCYLCPLQPLKELHKLYLFYPDLWNEMKRLDKMSWRKFKMDYTLDQIEDRFKRKTLGLFSCNNEWM